MKSFWAFSAFSASIVILTFSIVLSIFSNASPLPTAADKAAFMLFQNHVKSAFIAGVAILFVYGILKKQFAKNLIHRTAFSISVITAIFSCVGYIASFIQAIFLPAIILIFIANLKIFESLKGFIENNKLPKIVLDIPLLESLLIFSAMVIPYIVSTVKILK